MTLTEEFTDYVRNWVKSIETNEFDGLQLSNKAIYISNK